MAGVEIDRRMETVRFVTLLGLLTGCFLFGGASRNDVLSLLLLQPLAVICTAIFLFTPGPFRWTAVRIPLLFLGALASLIAVQLVPLPPPLAASLPGHAPFKAVAAAAGIAEPWRGISLTPDLTLASLVGLVTPLAVLVGFASLPVARTRDLLSALILGVSASALMGLAQIAGGPTSPFYTYAITNSGLPVGLFSNRNHQAVLLGMAWPMLALWATLPADHRFAAAKRWIAVSLALFFMPMLLVTGSRAGLALGIVGLIGGFMLWRRRDSGEPAPERWSRLLAPTALAGAICVLGATIVLSRDPAVERMLGMSFNDEGRVQYLPTVLRIAGDFFPLGAGFGSFDPLFRSYEPFGLLRPQYLNHAHNDLAELVLSGGLPALALLLAFLAWVGMRAFAVLRASDGGRTVAFARLSLLMIAFLLLSSLVDYPLRTPLMAAIFAIACGWLAPSDRPSRAAPQAIAR